MKILMTGATGLIGREVGKILARKGHHIVIVSRSLAKAREMAPFPCEVIKGDLSEGPLRDDRLEGVEAVINLIGEPVVGERWSEEKKKKIFESRVTGTKNLVASLPNSLRVFVSGSAIGYYGHAGNEVISETHEPGRDFLSRVCIQWEKEAAKAPGRKVFIRTSVVLAPQGGALEEMLFPFRAGVGGTLGNGSHWMSWIHLTDIANLFVFALENNNVEGPLNGSAPVPVTNKEFSKQLAAAVGRKLGPPIPLVALKVLFGEVSTVMLSSLRGSAEKAQSLGFQFKYPTLDKALTEICAPYKVQEEFFYAEQFIPEPPEKVFPFFQDAQNLEMITPPTLNFQIENMPKEDLHKGAVIDYRLKIRGVPVKWKTEIDEWQPPHRFVDNQVRGPYRFWHHTHEFQPFCGGTLMVDRVRYKLPGGFPGWLVASQWVRQDVENIFMFRRRYIATMDMPKKEK
ncbi:TIGR01777 family oxidoreductase [Bdellovibrio sp. 22V]|uniref:TIGR01777 family oxidoreductase n=1 Tax=Bdellovibrio TaxID=958 RepID=UPI0025430784|nr:TIGR01777 family oxidoreductase [Bdellovibrio sp. 22V]WII71573.1 TIGR01777 family oxidoreductase [Bdellovibrio sp. 22V]